MKLTLAATAPAALFVAACSYAERDLPKAAGFRWHGGGCRPGCAACAAGLVKVWWTDDTSRAVRLAEYATPEAKEALSGALTAQAASRASTVANLPAEVAALPVFVPEGLSLLPYQQAGVRTILAAFAAGRRGTLLADEMGLGKTVQALTLTHSLGMTRVLFIVPASLKLNWQREATRWAPCMVLHVVTESGPIPEDAESVVVNYDRLVRDAKLRESLMAREWELLVADEAHALKNPDAKRTQVVLGVPERKGAKARARVPGLIDRAEKVLWLSGTPILNRPVEAQGLLTALDPSFGSFGYLKRYCAAVEGRYGWDFSGASHLDELQSRLRSGGLMVRRMKADVLTELPPKRRQVVVLPRDGAEDALEAELAAVPLPPEGATYEEAVASLRAATVDFERVSEVRHATAMAKVPAVLEHLDNLMEEVEKLVIFAHHRDVVDALMAHLAPHGAVKVDGSTPMADRQAAVDRFQTDASCKVFVGNILAAGVGLTLTAASTVVFAELDWTPALITQAEDRCHRIGQRDSVLVQHLVFDGSLDARMAHLLVQKQAVADKMLDRDTDLKVTPEMEAAAAKDAAEKAEKKAAAEKADPTPEYSDEIRELAGAAMRHLAGNCDGAQEEDEVGFNKIDTDFGHELAARSAVRLLTPKETRAALRMARTYRRQLPHLAEKLGLFTPKAK